MKRSTVPLLPSYVRLIDNEAIARDVRGDAPIARVVGLALPRWRAMRRGAAVTPAEIHTIARFLGEPARELLRLEFPTTLIARRTGLTRRPTVAPAPRQNRLGGRLGIAAEAHESLSRLAEEHRRISAYIRDHTVQDRKLPKLEETYDTRAGLRIQIRAWLRVSLDEAKRAEQRLLVCEERCGAIQQLVRDLSAACSADIAHMQDQLVAAKSRRATSVEREAMALRARPKPHKR